MEYRLLGPLQIGDPESPVVLPGRKPGALLARLLLDAGRPVAVGRLVEDLWGPEAPDSASKMVQIYVSRLRKALPGARLQTRAPGYVLEVGPDALDLDRFRRLREAGRAALEQGDATRAAALLGEALDLWRGPALEEFAEPFARTESTRLDELRLACAEERVEAELALGRASLVVAELEALAARHPTRERLHALLMLALYRAGRQADALAAFRTLRDTMCDELGIEPGPELHELQARILRHDPSLRPAVAPGGAEAPASTGRAVPAPAAAPRGDFVGRRGELDRLAAVLDDALGGSPRFVILAGEPGIGKTRTATELATLAQERGAFVAWGRCVSCEGAPPWWPWVQALRTLAAGNEAAATPVAPEIAALVPGLVAGAAPPPGAESPQQARFRVVDSVAGYLAARARARPLAIVLDDLHDADDDSLLMVELVAHALVREGVPAILVGTYRDAEVSRRHPLAQTLAELARLPGFERLLLRGLGPEDSRRFIELAGLPASDGAVAEIERRTEGNPLFLREVVRLVLEDRAAGREPAGAVPARIPDGVRDVIGRRLQRLGEPCVEVLRAAAILGRAFSLKHLCCIVGVAEGALLSLIDEAAAAHVVAEVPREVGLFEFTHALFHEAVVADTPVADRVALHARAGQTLECAYGTDVPEHAAELAKHFGDGRAVTGVEPFIRYATLAGEHALAVHAHEDALAFFARGLAAAGQAAGPETARLLFGLARAQLATHELHELDEPIANLRRAFDMYVEAGEIERAVAVAANPVPPNLMYEPAGATELVERALSLAPASSPGAAQLRARLLVFSGWLSGINHADRAAAEEAFSQSLAVAREAGDERLELQALMNAQYVSMFHLRWDECLASGARAAALARRTGDQRAEIGTRGWRARALLAAGDLEAARAEVAAVHPLADEVRERYWVSTSCLHNALVAAMAGEWDAARRFTDRGLEARPHDPRNLGVRALVEFQTGEREAGADCLERMRTVITTSPPPGPGADYPLAAAFLPLCDGIAGTSSSSAAAAGIARQVLAMPRPTPYLTTCSHLGLGLIAAQAGDAAGALEAYAALEPVAGPMLVLPPVSLDRMLGLLAEAGGDLDLAIAHLERAVEACGRGRFAPERAWSALDCARALERRGDDGDGARASALRGEALAAARELGIAAPAHTLPA